MEWQPIEQAEAVKKSGELVLLHHKQWNKAGLGYWGGDKHGWCYFVSGAAIKDQHLVQSFMPIPDLPADA